MWEQVQRSPVEGAGPLQIPIEVRSERDPYLYFLDISGGAKDFGLTPGEKVRCSMWLPSTQNAANQDMKQKTSKRTATPVVISVMHVIVQHKPRFLCL
jgi:hypothetical protein